MKTPQVKITASADAGKAADAASSDAAAAAADAEQAADAAKAKPSAQLRVRCTILTAPEVISDVQFTDGVSDPLTPEQAEHFLSIKGYEPV